MANPVFHAVSSAKSHGGTMEDYLDIHHFFDHTKAYLEDPRHRMLLHNSWGIFIVEQKFGKWFRRRSDNKLMATRIIGEQHVKEDLRFIPTLARCFRGLTETVPHYYATHGMSIVMADRFGGIPEDYYSLNSWFDQCQSHVPFTDASRILHNTWGIDLACTILGPTFNRYSDGELMIVQEVLDYHCFTEMGGTLTVEEALKPLSIETWMGVQAMKLSQTLEEYR